MKRFILILLMSCALLSLATASKTTEEKKLKVGVTFAPPYIILGKGLMSGVCVDLWRLVSDSLKLSYEYKIYTSYDSLLEDLRIGKIDLTILPLTATGERLVQFRMTIPFFISNMGIATRIAKQSPFLQLAENIFSWKIIRLLLIILMVAAIFAVFIWMAERKHNPQQFRPGIMGVTDGIWWAFVTMTTVGYGDKIPRTVPGRILAILWMFFAISMFFIASGVVASELTVNQLQSQIKNSDDLGSCKVGAVSTTGYASTLSQHNIRYSSFKSPWTGLMAVKNGQIDAFVYDQAMLQYLIKRYNLKDEIMVISSGLNLQYFSFMGAKDNLELIDRINPAILNAIDSDEWKAILLRHGIGKEDIAGSQEELNQVWN